MSVLCSQVVSAAPKKKTKEFVPVYAVRGVVED